LPLQYLALLLKIVRKSQQYLKQSMVCARLRYSLQYGKDKKFVKSNVNVQDQHIRCFLRSILRMEHRADSPKLRLS
jgi:hypothetical protein